MSSRRTVAAPRAGRRLADVLWAGAATAGPGRGGRGGHARHAQQERAFGYLDRPGRKRFWHKATEFWKSREIDPPEESERKQFDEYMKGYWVSDAGKTAQLTTAAKKFVLDYVHTKIPLRRRTLSVEEWDWRVVPNDYLQIAFATEQYSFTHAEREKLLRELKKTWKMWVERDPPSEEAIDAFDAYMEGLWVDDDDTIEINKAAFEFFKTYVSPGHDITLEDWHCPYTGMERAHGAIHYSVFSTPPWG